MASFHVHIDEMAYRRLSRLAAEMGRSIEDLMASAAEEAALHAFRHRTDDPARPPVTGARR